jgi:DnaK suppressor protein
MTTVTVPQNYSPTEKETYMNPVMLEYFRHKLLHWKTEIVREADITLQDLQDEGGMQEPDITDRASAETEVALELRTRDRQRKLISKIDEALERIERNEYGFCEETGEPIGIKRLEARPIATLTVEAQERHERRERTQRDERE